MSRHPGKRCLKQDTIAEEYINFITKHAVSKATKIKKIEEQTEGDKTFEVAIYSIPRNRSYEADNIQDTAVTR